MNFFKLIVCGAVAVIFVKLSKKLNNNETKSKTSTKQLFSSVTTRTILHTNC